jgi:hypothetical protein
MLRKRVQYLCDDLCGNEVAAGAPHKPGSIRGLPFDLSMFPDNIEGLTVESVEPELDMLWTTVHEEYDGATQAISAHVSAVVGFEGYTYKSSLHATTLLTLVETTKRCSYFQVTDDDGKGQITRATGPRWDSLSNLKKNINATIQAAKSQQGDARAALVRTGYDWIRAWCEVFTETDLLQGVTQRYQPNVRMTNLPKIKTRALPATIETVSRIFEEACRYIDGHSQPLPSLSVSPTVAGLEAHWAELAQARSAYSNAVD